MMYNLQIRQFLYEKYIELKNLTKVQRAYRTKYKTSRAPCRFTILNIARNFQNTGYVGRKRVHARRKHVRTDELIKSVENLIIEDPRISIRKIRSVVGHSYGVIRNLCRKDLKLKPYKPKRTFKLYKLDHRKRLEFVQFLKNRRLNVEDYFICSDEAYFYLHGGHNIQNERIWAIFQPNEIAEAPLNDDKVMVWCAFSAKRVYGPYFFDETVKWTNYLDMLKNFFWPKHARLEDSEKFYFQQDGASPHRKKEVQEWLKAKFGKRFIESHQWPPRSPDLNPCDYSLWGTLKHRAYNPRPKNIEELRENIEREFRNFKKTDLKPIFSNLKKRLELLEIQKGGHFEHLL